MNPNSIVVLGLQWGDEGKGKVIDYLSADCHAIARFGGGANAGHTIVVDGEKYILKLLPSGVLHKDKLCLIGPGVACDPYGIKNEIDELSSRGISVEGRLFIDYGVHLVLPIHRAADGYRENSRGKGAIDTTKRGIGPSYSDRAARVGIRAADIFQEATLQQKVENLLVSHKACIDGIGEKSLADIKQLTADLLALRPFLEPKLTDIGPKVMELIESGKKVMFEGAQGTLLDIDHGSYPYVTSSHTSIGGLFTGLGIPPKMLGETIGVAKAYITRVGHGPFPSELFGDFADKLREAGGEYGSVTGRPRRVGWLDLAILKRIVKLNGVDKLIITKLDVLDDLDEVYTCESYDVNGTEYESFPASHPDFPAAKPVLKRHDGWDGVTAGVTEFEKLPEKAKEYLKYISDFVGVPIWLVSTGSARESTIIVE